MQRSIKKMSSSSLRKKQLSLVFEEEGAADIAQQQSTEEKKEKLQAVKKPNEEVKQQDLQEPGFFSSKQEVSEIGKPPLAVKKQLSPDQNLQIQSSILRSDTSQGNIRKRVSFMNDEVRNQDVQSNPDMDLDHLDKYLLEGTPKVILPNIS